MYGGPKKHYKLIKTLQPKEIPTLQPLQTKKTYNANKKPRTLQTK